VPQSERAYLLFKAAFFMLSEKYSPNHLEISDIVFTFAAQTCPISPTPMQMPQPLPLWKWMLMLITAFAVLNTAYFQKDRMWLSDSTILILIGSVIITVGIIVLYHLWRRFVERRNANDLLLRGMLPSLLKGCLLGAVLYVLCTALTASLGLYRVETTGADFLGVWPAFFYCFMIGVCEEIIFRGIIFRYVDKRINFWFALIFSAVFFGIAHLPRPWISVFEIALGMGLLEAVLYRYSRTLWLPIGVHFAWDSLCCFFEGGYIPILLHFDAPLRAIPSDRGFAVGDWQGIESATISIILHLLVIMWFLRRIKDI